jgi:hypothetical protein
MQNKTGKWINPSIASVTAAANVAIPADSKVSLTNTDAADGYPISGFSWVNYAPPVPTVARTAKPAGPPKDT